MTFKHKLARRLARLRTLLLLAPLIGGACEFRRDVAGNNDGSAITQLLISPAAVSLQPSQTTEFVVVGLTDVGDTGDISVSWSVTAGSITDTSTVGRRHYGRYKAHSDTGRFKVMVRERTQEAADTADVTVSWAPVASVTVIPASASVGVGRSVQLTAIAKDESGNVLPGRPVSWTTDNASVATVSGTGLVSGVAAGSATITATSEGHAGTSAITVIVPPPAGLPAFPGAEGFGATTPGGRGGTVLRVTNLNESGAGSLREALEASGPRVVIFEVSGTIVLTSNINIGSPYITVAGQTAPSPGISVRGAAIRVSTHDAVLQHLRIRVGDDPSGPSPSNRDGLDIYGSEVYNVVADHMSVSWGVDENVSTSTSGIRRDITISNSIISEGLSNSLKGTEHSKGFLIGQTSKTIALIRSLMAHNKDRNPYAKGGTTTLVVNNVVYNWGGGKAFSIDDWNGNGPDSSTIIGNVYIRGVNTGSGRPIHVYDMLPTTTRIFADDNSENRAPPPADPWTLVQNDVGTIIRATAPPVWVQPLTILSNAEVEEWVLTNAGARPADRDAVDARIVNEVRTGTGHIIDATSEVGGWPPLAENRRPLTLPPNPDADDDGDGYTNLEEWLHQFAAVVEGRSP